MSKRNTRKLPKQPKGNRYLTMNNGANYWLVEDFPKEKRVVIYKHNVDPLPSVGGRQTGKEENVKVTEMHYTALWIPHKDSGKFMEGIWSKSTFIIQNKNTFFLIYNSISKFTLRPGDSPVKYMSPVGNNDSPYPYLIGEKFLYFFVSDAEYAPKESFDFSKDINNQYLGINGEEPASGVKPLPSKELFSPCDCRWRGSTNCAKPCKR